MSLYNSLLEKLILPMGDALLRSDYLKNLKKWRKIDTFKEEELGKIQEKEIKKILKYAIKEVPFYNNIGYDEELSAVENLKQFPLLTKDILREERENLVSNLYNQDELQKNYSSGSSGIQSYSYSTKNNKYLLQGIQGHWYEWAGYKVGDKIIQFGISPNRKFPKNLKDLFYRVIYQNAFSLSNNDFESLYLIAKRKKVNYIIGYPSAINEFSKYLNENNLRLPIKGVVSLGDKLFPSFEKNFYQSFEKPKIIDTYGCAEGLMMACKDDLPYYYIMSPHVYIEIVDINNKPVKDGEIGYVLVTCFTNLAQPFIRYKLGDLAIKLPIEKYPLKRKYNYPLLEKIVGRETDLVKTPTQKTLIVHSFTGIFEYFPEIKQYRIIQDQLEKITIEYITDSHFSFSDDSLNKIKAKINDITDNSLEITFLKTDYIPATPSGKPQIIKSIFKF